MLKGALSILGFDIDAETARITALLESYRARTLEEARSMASALAFRFGMLAGAGALAIATVVVLVIAAYRSIEPHLGPVWSLLIVAAILAVLAAILFLTSRSEQRMEPIHSAPAVPPVAAARRPEPDNEFPPPPRRDQAAAYADPMRVPLKVALSSFLNSPPVSGTRLDLAFAQLGREASASSEATVDAAADLMRRGSRSAVFGVLAASLALGWLVARKTVRS